MTFFARLPTTSSFPRRRESSATNYIQSERFIAIRRYRYLHATGSPAYAGDDDANVHFAGSGNSHYFHMHSFALDLEGHKLNLNADLSITAPFDAMFPLHPY